MMQGWIEQLAGKFIVFDGPDGSGKSTQFRRFCHFAKQHGHTICEVREPGGTQIGEAIRDMLLDPAFDEMDVRCEVMMYMASRAQLVAQKIGPAIERGELVLADRFISSTLAYQGTAGGMDYEEIMQVGRVAVGEHWPDLVVVFDVDETTAASRLNPLLDRMEQKGAEYHARVRQGYLKQVADDPAGYLKVDATQEVDAVFAELCAGVAAKMRK